jgi:hypothetical protein
MLRALIDDGTALVYLLRRGFIAVDVEGDGCVPLT